VKKTASINLEINLFVTRSYFSGIGSGSVDLPFFRPPQIWTPSTSSVETLYGGSSGLLHARQRAESVRLYSKNWVELAAKVFESDDRS